MPPKSSAKGIAITDLVVANINVVKDPKYKKFDELLPTVLTPQILSCKLNGVSTAVANGIRRVLLGEMPVSTLTFNIDNYQTNDEFLSLSEFIQKRIQSIPVKQSIDSAEVFSIDAKNTTTEVIAVKSGDILSKSKKPLPFDDTITVIKLNPGKFIKIPNIYVVSGKPSDSGTFNAVQAARTIPQIEMYNMYEATGISSSVSDPQVHELLFETNGTINPVETLFSAIKIIIDRLLNIKTHTKSIEQIESNIYQLIILNENDTTGNIMLKAACQLYPDVDFTYRVNFINHTLSFKLRSSSPDDIINDIIDYSVDTLNKLLSSKK